MTQLGPNAHVLLEVVENPGSKTRKNQGAVPKLDPSNLSGQAAQSVKAPVLVLGEIPTEMGTPKKRSMTLDEDRSRFKLDEDLVVYAGNETLIEDLLGDVTDDREPVLRLNQASAPEKTKSDVTAG